MRFIFGLVLLVNLTSAQLLGMLVDLLNPIYEAFSDNSFNEARPNSIQNNLPPGFFGTPEPLATGRDELFPADCGRHPADGTGKLCFPDGILCQRSE
jgi:hypothetical protein